MLRNYFVVAFRALRRHLGSTLINVGGLAIGVARTDDGQLLQRFGADVVVADVGELCVADLRAWFEENLEEEGLYFGPSMAAMFFGGE